MKGKFKLKIEETHENGPFPITSSWEYVVDNTPESIDDYIELFNNIIAVKGFRGTLGDYYIGGNND